MHLSSPPYKGKKSNPPVLRKDRLSFGTGKHNTVPESLLKVSSESVEIDTYSSRCHYASPTAYLYQLASPTAYLYQFASLTAYLYQFASPTAYLYQFASPIAYLYQFASPTAYLYQFASPTAYLYQFASGTGITYKSSRKWKQTSSLPEAISYHRCHDYLFLVPYVSNFNGLSTEYVQDWSI
jgi:hypothetical protein